MSNLNSLYCNWKPDINTVSGNPISDPTRKSFIFFKITPWETVRKILTSHVALLNCHGHKTRLNSLANLIHEIARVLSENTTLWPNSIVPVCLKVTCGLDSRKRSKLSSSYSKAEMLIEMELRNSICFHWNTNSNTYWIHIHSDLIECISNKIALILQAIRPQYSVQFTKYSIKKLIFNYNSKKTTENLPT